MIIEAETISLYDAIAEMRELSIQKKPFNFVHACYDSSRKVSTGISVVNKASLRKAAKEEDVKNSSFKLFYYDMELHEPRVCWQPLLLFFNGKKIVLQ